MEIKPIGNRILLEVLKAKEKTVGGIYIPASAQEKTHEGIVKEIGANKKEEIDIRKGDVVIYDKYAGSQMTIDGKEYLILKFEDIIAKYTKSA